MNMKTKIMKNKTKSKPKPKRQRYFILQITTYNDHKMEMEQSDFQISTPKKRKDEREECANQPESVECVVKRVRGEYGGVTTALDSPSFYNFLDITVVLVSSMPSSAQIFVTSSPRPGDLFLLAKVSFSNPFIRIQLLPQ